MKTLVTCLLITAVIVVLCAAIPIGFCLYVMLVADGSLQTEAEATARARSRSIKCGGIISPVAGIGLFRPMQSLGIT